MIPIAYRIRINIILGLIIMSFMGIVIRLYYLQVIKFNEFKKKVNKQYITTMTLKPRRGTIYDCKMKELAITIEVPSVFAIPKEIDDKEKVALKLSSILNLKYETLLKKFNSEENFVWIKRQLSEEENAKVEKENFKGIHFLKEPCRFYPYKTLASHILGFVNIDNKGLEGIEFYYDKFLKSNSQKITVRRDAKQRIIIPPDCELSQVFRRYNIKLNIDITIQYIVERELNKAYIDSQAKSATAIVIEPTTGKILALANRPNFNPNNISYYTTECFRNRAITDLFEPGSTFKVFIAATALETNTVNPSDLIYCEEGKFNVASRLIHDVHGYGWLSFKEVIEKSSNIGTIKIGMNTEKINLYNSLYNFGFGKKTQIDLPGESRGVLRKVSQWSKLSIAAISIGQEVSVSAIQLITAFASIANQGVLMKPYIVDEIIDSSGQTIKKFYPQEIGKIISFSTINRLTEILKGVVENGTGKLASVPNYEVAGKTGTAQKIDFKTLTYSPDKFVASFIGYIPVNTPKVAILVIIDEPKGFLIYGGEVAAPVFSKIAEEIMKYLEVTPQGENNLKDEKPNDDKIICNKGEVIVPSLYGRTMRETLEILWELNLHPIFIGSGIAYFQEPLPEEKIEVGTICKVKFSN